MSLPPKRIEVTDEGHFPVINRYIRAFNEVTKVGPFTLFEVRSRKCYGRMPPEPPADPAGKELMAEVTSSSVNWTAGSLEGSAPHCIVWWERRMTFEQCLQGVGTAYVICRTSSDARIRMAAFMLPSSILDTTAVVRY